MLENFIALGYQALERSLIINDGSNRCIWIDQIQNGHPIECTLDNHGIPSIVALGNTIEWLATP